MHAYVGLITLIGRPESTCIVPATVGQHVWKLYMRPFLVCPDLVDANLHASASFYFRFQIRGDGIRKKNQKSHTSGQKFEKPNDARSVRVAPAPPPSFVAELLFFVMPVSGVLWKENAQKWVETSQKQLRHIKCPSEGQQLCILVLRVCGTLWAQQICIYCISCAP